MAAPAGTRRGPRSRGSTTGARLAAGAATSCVAYSGRWFCRSMSGSRGRSPSLVPVSQFFRDLGIEDDRERAALHAIGFPMVPPAEGETVARTSPQLAERWLTMLSLFVETVGGDGAIKANLGAEILRLEAGDIP